ncbi:RNA-directed DNA polymerase from mobile element jockey [Trichonephila clavipes]|nr:RNA-directed DNA polymerase from mobile element jockey [Trichonephila clavipes]
MAYSDFEKSEAFKDTLEVTFQENAESYSGEKIEEVGNLVNHYFDNFNTHIPPLTSSPLEVRSIIENLSNRKSAGPDQIPNIALKYLLMGGRRSPKLQRQFVHLPCLQETDLKGMWGCLKSTDSMAGEAVSLHSLLPNRNCKIYRQNFEADDFPCGAVNLYKDVKRAFDKMWHDGLTYKMVKLKTPAYLIKMIYNYLHNRTFQVRVNNIFSHVGFLQSGTPQGSVLSPYLYNIYTYDFPDHPTVSTCLFADDSAALTLGVHLNYTIKAMQNYLDILEDWFTHWRIAINVEKTKDIVFRKEDVIDPHSELTLFQNNIQRDSVVRYLCLPLDNRLT